MMWPEVSQNKLKLSDERNHKTTKIGCTMYKKDLKTII